MLQSTQSNYIIRSEDDELYHFGVKGMKWGVRRYQNEDGSLTQKGRDRYSKKQTNLDHNINNRSLRKEKWGTALITAATIPISLAMLQAGYINPTLLATSVSSIGFIAASIKGEVDAVIANNKEKKILKEKENTPVDKKTGFHKQTTDLSAKEQLSRVNPGYKNWDLNTKNNCMLCTSTMELRMRGYDVQAKKATFGFLDSDITRWFKKAQIKEMEGSITQRDIDRGVRTISPKRQKKIITNFISEVISQGNGARGNLLVNWNRTLGGHSMYYMVENGKVTIYDAQANKIYNDPYSILRKTSSISYARLDNLELNYEHIREVAS